MAQILDATGHSTPAVLTYIDKGLGASILKAGLRLWDGGDLSPVAAVKITRHNLLRPTAAIHEAGHQVAHITGWNDELASELSRALTPISAMSQKRGRAGRRRSPPMPSRSSTQGLPASPPCTTCSRVNFRRCSGTHPGIRTRFVTCES